MSDQSAEPRDLRPRPEADAPLRHRQDPSQEPAPVGRWEREAESPGESGPENTVTKTSRVFVFVMAAIIVLAIAAFLILHPQAGD
jgi:hypothetical protein